MEPQRKDSEIQGTPGSLMGSPDAEPFIILEDGENQTRAPQAAAPAASTRVGIAVGDREVAFAGTEFHSGKLRLLERASAQIGGQGPAALTLALRQAAKGLSRKPRSIDLVLPATICEYQVVNLPPMDPKAQGAYLSQLASRATGAPEACFAVLPLAVGAIASEVLLVAAAKEKVEGIVRACHQAGLIPERAVPPFAPALSLFATEVGSAKDPAILVDLLSLDEVNLLVWDEGRVRVHRNIRKEPGSDRWEEFLDSEVYRTVAFYRTHSGGKRVNRLYLHAHGEEGGGLRARFEAVGMFEAGVKGLVIEGLGTEGGPCLPLAAAAGALALPEAPRVDLLPAELRNPRRRQFLTAVTFSLAAIAALGEAFSYRGLWQLKRERQGALEAATDLAEALAHHGEEYRQVQGRREAFRKRVDDFEARRRQAVPLSDALASILSTRSGKIYFKSLAVQANGRNGAYEVVIHGAADNRYALGESTEIDRFLESLRKVPGARFVDRTTKKTSAPTSGGSQREEFQIRVVFPVEVEKP